MNTYEQRIADRKQRMEAKSAKLRAEASALYDSAKKMASIIPFGQPILVGHHSECADRSYRKRIGNKFDKSLQADKMAAEMESRAESIGTGGISSDDPDAIKKLGEDLAICLDTQNRMKAANKIKCGTYRAFQLSNNNANIKRIADRIELLKKAKTRVSAEIVINGIRARQNVEANRVQLFFPDKPDDAMRAKLKSSGFRWAPSEGAWQRQLTNNAISVAKDICRAHT